MRVEIVVAAAANDEGIRNVNLHRIFSIENCKTTNRSRANYKFNIKKTRNLEETYNFSKICDFSDIFENYKLNINLKLIQYDYDDLIIGCKK